MTAIPPPRSGQAPKPDPWFTAAEVAAFLRVSKMTVYRLTASGELKAKRIGNLIRIRLSAIDQYLANADVADGEA